ncbi:MAG: response regulator transcription factor [Pseudomonadota bacterium]
MRILVIEDERKISAFIKRGLKEEGHAVDVGYDGEEGYHLIGENDYDLIILDLMLPKLDGITLCKQIRADGIQTPIIMLTAKSTVQDKVTGLDSGANDYITKPFAFEELLARIRVILRKSAQVTTKLQVAGLALDLLTHKVTRDGEEIILSAKEFSLLEYLMRNAGMVITRTMISEHVWDIDFDTSTNVIDVYINYLRNKIDSRHEKKLIHTVRGRGYTLKE